MGSSSPFLIFSSCAMNLFCARVRRTRPRCRKVHDYPSISACRLFVRGTLGAHPAATRASASPAKSREAREKRSLEDKDSGNRPPAINTLKLRGAGKLGDDGLSALDEACAAASGAMKDSLAHADRGAMSHPQPARMATDRSGAMKPGRKRGGRPKVCSFLCPFFSWFPGFPGGGFREAPSLNEENAG